MLDEAIALADEIASYQPLYNEGDMGELIIETVTPVSSDILETVRNSVKTTGALLVAVYQTPEGVHVQFKVGFFPLWAIALVSVAALIPVGVFGYKLLKWTPEEMRSFLLPFALIGAGVLVASIAIFI